MGAGTPGEIMAVKKTFVGLFSLLLAVALFATACSSSATSTQTPDPIFALSVSDAWVRPGIDPTAVYLTITNSGTESVTLTGVEAAWAGEIDMHETVNEDGFLAMEHMPSLAVPAGGSVTFAPGGMHLMAQDVHGDISDGDGLELAFLTDTGKRVGFSAVARGQSGMVMNDTESSHDHEMDDDNDEQPMAADEHDHAMGADGTGMEVEKHGAVFASGTIPPGNSFKFVFDHSLGGIKIPYHNHLDASSGTVMVMDGEDSSDEITVTIKEDGYHPADLHIAPGTEVTWINSTEVAWTVINGYHPDAEQSATNSGS